ncbi:hypothetical protein M8C21_015874 [Ambrosia artemisiifolia]|uniref:Uncharacterized protein n=1 Tax=Ambrosia artemisiifolia TaxID=4212 RepID=A0AAD5D275_AMBAR|nr:hypothetical protein M8C21_015874 [Ambrosia artemisiifolia]
MKLHQIRSLLLNIKDPVHIPVSIKGGRVNGRSKVTKNNKAAPRTPVSNSGLLSPLTPASNCCYDSSIDVILDLNNAADILEVIDASKPEGMDDGVTLLQAEVQRLSMEENRLDENIRKE